MTNSNPGIENIASVEQETDGYGNKVGFLHDLPEILHISAIEEAKRPPLRLRPGLLLAMMSGYDGARFSRSLVEQARSVKFLPMDAMGLVAEGPILLTYRDRTDSQIVGGVIAEPGKSILDESGKKIVDDGVVIEAWSGSGSNDELSKLYGSILPVAKELYGEDTPICSVEALVPPRPINPTFLKKVTSRLIGEPESDNGVPEVVAEYYDTISDPGLIHVEGLTTKPFYGVVMQDPKVQ